MVLVQPHPIQAKLDALFINKVALFIRSWQRQRASASLPRLVQGQIQIRNIPTILALLMQFDIVDKESICIGLRMMQRSNHFPDSVLFIASVYLGSLQIFLEPYGEDTFALVAGVQDADVKAWVAALSRIPLVGDAVCLGEITVMYDTLDKFT